jgi:TatD DNase family protein
MIDTHAHLDSCKEPDEELVAEAAAAGVSHILTIGREQAVALAERFPGVYAVVGWHPHEAEVVADPSRIEPLLRHPRVVAVGECGLDYFRDYAPRDDQLRVFRAQVEIANRVGKPLVIHTRAADDDTFEVLTAAEVPVVLHCFSSVGLTDEAIDRGYFFSFAGNVTYRSAQVLRDAAARIPADRILAETDCPYLSPVPQRGKPNRPARVMDTLALLAEVRGVPPAELEEQIERNAERVFGL